MHQIVLALTLVSVAVAHSNLGYPLPYSTISCKASESWCKGACPPLWKSVQSKFDSPDKPAATWRRGESVEIVWHKNNHIGGFYRRALVPVKYMMDRAWHQKTAFEWGCWSQGTFQCGKSAKCGGDKKGRAYKNMMTVPTVFPDGDYVFAQVWYGGLHWQGKKPKYSDYFACSFVRIKGGELTSTYKAKFRSGPKKRNIPEGVCATGSTRTMQCGGDGCEKGPVLKTKPVEFQNGDGPTLKISMFGGDVLKKVDVKEKEPDSEAKQAIAEQKQDKKEDAQIAAEEQKALRASPGLEKEMITDVPEVMTMPTATVTPTPSHSMTTMMGASEEIEGSPAPSPGVNEMESSTSPEPTFTPEPDMRLEVKKEGVVHHYFWKWFNSNGDEVAQNDSKSGCGAPPPEPKGTWGKKYSVLWFKQRNMMVKRREYCRICECEA